MQMRKKLYIFKLNSQEAMDMLLPIVMEAHEMVEALLKGLPEIYGWGAEESARPPSAFSLISFNAFLAYLLLVLHVLLM